MIDIRYEKMFPKDVFVMDHVVDNVNYINDIDIIEKIFTEKLKKAKQTGKYNYYVFNASTDGWVNLFNNFVSNNDVIPITGNLDFSSNWKWFPHWMAVTDSIDPPSTNRNIPKYRWQYWVRRPRPHRIHLIKEIARRNISYGDIIFPHHLIEPTGRTYLPTKELFQDNKLYDSIQSQFNPALDIPQGENGAYIPSYNIRQNRAIDVVTETMTQDRDGIFLSEKTFKAIRAGQIPIILGQKGTIASLHKYGFKTFNKWIDHSYDDTWDEQLKASMIADELKRICSMSQDDYEQMWHDTYRDRLYNQSYKNYKLDYWKRYLNSFFV
jgi:hypothetical protein